MNKRKLALFILVLTARLYAQTSSPEIEKAFNLESDKATEIYVDEETVKKSTEPEVKEVVVEENQSVSKIENLYKSYGYDLKQFGYTYLKARENEVRVYNDSSYILGADDTIKVYLWGDPVDIGELLGQYKLTVNNSGSIYFPAVGLLNVSGKSVSSVESIIRTGLEQKYKKFSLEVSVVNYKNFSVSVTGMVNSPGVVEATSLSTLFTVLSRAGGISKEGSLRNVIVKRGGEEMVFDLYDSLIYGNNSVNTFVLQEGDSVLVKSIGSVVAIAGSVKKAGIFEIKGSSTLDKLIEYSGGELVSSYRNEPLYFYLDTKDGVIKSRPVEMDSMITDEASVIFFPYMSAQYGDSVMVKGAVRNPGRFKLEDGMTLASLVSTLEFNVNANMFYGEIVRQKKGEFKEYFTFKPGNVDNEDLELLPGDIVSFYNYSDGNSVNKNLYRNVVTINGLLTGSFVASYKEGDVLNSYISNENLPMNLNVYYGEIVRTNSDRTNEFITFKPEDLLSGKPLVLQAGDSVNFYQAGIKKSTNEDIFRTFAKINGIIGGSLLVDTSSETFLNDIIRKDMLPIDLDMDYATIVRVTEAGQDEEILTFSPAGILNNEEKVVLHNLDSVVFYNKWDYQPIIVSGELKESFMIDYYEGVTLLDALSGAEFDTNIESLRARITFGRNGTDDLINAKTVYLHDLLALGKPSADLKLTPGSNILIQILSEREDRSRVKILGGVNQPGIVKINEDTTLYDVLSKSGGLRKDSYLKGLVLIRESAKRRQREQLEITLNTMETQLQSMALEAEKSSLSDEALASVRSQVVVQSSLLDLTRSRAEMSLGRLSLTLPNTLEELKNSDDNIKLEKGDYIYIPTKPDYVLVLGNVYNQISVKYNASATVKEYLNRVGGDKKDSGDFYIVHANGEITSQRSKGFFSKGLKDRTLEPGDVIVVPQEIKVPGHIAFADSFERIIDVIYKTSMAVFTTDAMLNKTGVY